MRGSIAAWVAVLLLALAARVEAQASLDAARDLYAAAEYESALRMLDGLKTVERPRDEERAIDLYRILCLVATGKEGDARTVMESLVNRNPLYRPSDELPPRVRSTYNEIRRRLLPSTVQGAYQEAKAAFDFKDYAAAKRGFALVLDVLAEPDIEALAAQPPLADLRTLAAGFHELSAKAAAPPPPVVPATPAAASAPAARQVARPAAPAPRIYSASDTNVVPPIVLKQEIPPFRGTVRVAQTGVIEVLIDTHGEVESATMLASINPQYDNAALEAARTWQYQPARVDGVPVKFVKRIQVNLVPND